MRKFLTAVVAGFMAISAMAGITNDMDSAFSAFNSGQYGQALTTFEAVLVDYPEEEDDYLAGAQFHIGAILRRQKDLSGAESAFRATITDYPNASIKKLSNAQWYLGNALREQGKLDDAIEAYEMVFTNYPTASANQLVLSKMYIGHSLRAQGKLNEAQLAYESGASDFITATPAQSAASQALLISVKIEQRLDVSADCLKVVSFGDSVFLRRGVTEYARYMTPEDYTMYLTRVLMIVPATDENAEFLGKVKSQLELLK